MRSLLTLIGKGMDYPAPVPMNLEMDSQLDHICFSGLQQEAKAGIEY